MQVEKRIIGSTVTLVLISAALVGLVVVPAIFKIKNMTAQLNEQHGEIERHYLLRNYVKQTRDDIIDAQKELEYLRKTFIQEGQELQFIESLEKAANVSGVEQNINLETVNQKNITAWEKEIPLKINISGPFPGVMSWLNEIEHLEYYVLFEQMSISVQRIGGGVDPQGKVNANFYGKVFWIAEDAPHFTPLKELDPSDIAPTEPTESENES